MKNPKKQPHPQALPSSDREHIFQASTLEPLALRWKELHNANRHAEAMLVLEQVIIGATAMFARLAQYEDFHYTVDLPILISAAQEKVVKWLIKWQPAKGRLFTWFSRCAKHAFLSELAKVNQFRKRFHVTSDNLEKFYGQDDHEINKHDLAQDFRTRLEGLTCRWGDPQEIGAIQFIVESIVDDDEHDRQIVARTAAFAYGLGFETTKFFYAWVMCSLRNIFYDKVHVPFTEQDLLRAGESYSLFIDFVDIAGVDIAKKVMVIMGGNRLRVPTIAYLQKLKDDERLFRELAASDLDPDSVAEIAKKHKKSAKTASEIFSEMTETLNPKRFGEYNVYDNSE